MSNVGSQSDQGEQGLSGQAAARAQDAAAAVQEKASEVREQGRSKLAEELDSRSSQAGSQMRSLASSLRESSGSLRNDGNAQAASMTDQVAGRVDRFGSYLEQTSGDRMMRDVEDFARRRPWMIAGVGLLAGFALARFVKASSESRYTGSRGASGPSSNGGGDGDGRYGALPAAGVRSSGGISSGGAAWTPDDVRGAADRRFDPPLPTDAEIEADADPSAGASRGRKTGGRSGRGA